MILLLIADSENLEQFSTCCRRLADESAVALENVGVDCLDGLTFIDKSDGSGDVAVG